MATTWLRSLLMGLTIAAIGPTTAISSLHGEDSVIRFVGPTDRVQPQSTNEAVAPTLPTNALLPTPQEFTLPKLNTTFKSILQHAFNPPVWVAYHHPKNQQAKQNELPHPEGNVEEITKPQGNSLSKDLRPHCLAGPPLSSLSTDISLPTGALPTDIAAKCASTQAPIVDPRSQGHWAMTNYRWAATGLRHRPLYFEEVNAERYGYTTSYVLQPLISAGRFFLTIPTLPYKMAVDCPRRCTYTLGHYRPGSCAPWRWQHLPLKATGAAAQVGVVAALILLIP